MLHFSLHKHNGIHSFLWIMILTLFFKFVFILYHFPHTLFHLSQTILKMTHFTRQLSNNPLFSIQLIILSSYLILSDSFDFL